MPPGAGGARVRIATVIPAAFPDAVYRTALVSPGLAQAQGLSSGLPGAAATPRRCRGVSGLTATYCEHVRGQRAVTWLFRRGVYRRPLSGTSGIELDVQL